MCKNASPKAAMQGAPCHPLISAPQAPRVFTGAVDNFCECFTRVVNKKVPRRLGMVKS